MFSVKKIIKNIDLFGQPIQFTFNQQATQKSFFGGSVTLILLTLFLAISFQGFLDVITRADITAYTNDIYSPNPPFIDFSPGIPNSLNWAITFSPTDFNVWDGPGQFFTLTALQGVYTRDQNGVDTKIKTPIPLVPCQLDYFDVNSQAVLLGMTNNVSTFLCPQQNISLSAQGQFSSANFSFLNFVLSQCVNSTTVLCAPTEAIDAIFAANQGKVNLNILITNNIINLYDLETSVSSFMDSRTNLMINLNAYQELNYYFTQQKIFTDDSIITTDYVDDIDTFVFDDNFDISTLPLAADVVYCSIYFRSNFLANYNYRTFEKIGKFISYIGGFWSVLFLFFSIIGKSYNKNKLLVKMSNELYDFESQNYEDLLKKQAKENNPKIRANPQKQDHFKKVKLVEKGDNQSEGSRVNKSIHAYLEKKDEFKLMKGIRYLFGCFFKNTEKEKFKVKKKLKQHAFWEIYKDVDIIHLLKKLKQIDKLKALILNDTQISLFDFNHKTKINENFDMKNSLTKFMERMQSRRKSRKISINRNEREDGFKEIKNYYESYVLLKKDNSEKNSHFNNKIISFIDGDLLSIFQNISDTCRVENVPSFFQKESLTLTNFKVDSEKSEHRILAKPITAKKSAVGK